MDTERKNRPSRRTFLFAVGAGSVAAAAAVMNGGHPTSQQSSAREKNGGQGYRLTGHVRNYYRTAQI